MARRISKTALVLVTTFALLGFTGHASAKTTHPAAAMVAKISGRIKGAPSKAKVLAVTSTGASAFGTIKRGQLSVKLPKTSSKVTTFSLHLVTSKKSYAGSISIGKVENGKKKWYAAMMVASGATVTLPTISFNAKQKWGAVVVTSATPVIPTTKLVGAKSSGKPKGAGRLGLGVKKKTRSSSAIQAGSIRVSQDNSATNPGDDLDKDGIPNTLDIDDNGNGLADTVDQATSQSSDSSTTTYDAISSLASGWGTSTTRFANPNNYNLMDPTLTEDELKKELSILADANFRMTIRAVAPFFMAAQGTYIKAAWVDCTGLAWCLSKDDLSDRENPVYAPRMLSTSDGDGEAMWQYAYTPTPGSPCNVHNANSCDEALWGEFSMKTFLQNANTNGSPDIDQSDVDFVGDQPEATPGFGLMDNYVLAGYTGGKGNSAGFDLGADINPHGGVKFLDNIKTGDVFTINALLSDGTTSSIAMTIAPYFVTAPTVINYTPGGGVQTDVAYDQPDPNCAAHTGNEDCRPGSEGNPFTISASNPTLDLNFWRPQRLRIAGVDDALGDAPLVDMGGLDYRVSVQGGDGSPFVRCPNSAVEFTNSGSESSTPWISVIPTDGYSNSFEFMKDPTSDAQVSVDRTVHLHINFADCTGLDHSSGDTSYNVRFEADSQPTFGGNRGNTMQTFYFKFQ